MVVASGCWFQDELDDEVSDEVSMNLHRNVREEHIFKTFKVSVVRNNDFVVHLLGVLV